MIALTRLNNKDVVVNCDQIVFVEATPDTRLTLTTGERCMVRESVAEVIRRVESYRRRCTPLLCEPTTTGENRQEVSSWTSQP